VTLNVGNAAGSSNAVLLFNGDQTLGTSAGATGIVVLGGSSNDRLIQSFGGQTLTIGNGITIRGDDGIVGGAASTLVNHGTIDADTSGGTINVALGANGSNSGTIKADSGGSLTVLGSSAGTWTNEAGATIGVTGGGTLGIDNNPADPWTNLGTISTTASTMNLNGAFTQAGLGTFSRDAASTVNLTGKLTGDVALNASTGSWNLVGGELSAGTFSASGATLLATGQGGTLNAETLDSPIDFSTNNGATATVTGGLSLDNVTLNVGNAAGSSTSVLFFNGDQTLGATAGATGIVVLGGSSSDRLIQSFGGQTLTIGSGVTIEGNDGAVGAAASTLVNQGTIDADTSGGTLVVSGTLANFAAGTLTGGTWKATGGVLLLPQIAIATDAANLIVDGTGASILAHSSSGTVNALAGLSEIGAGSSLALLNGATLTTNTALTNNGTLTVGVGSTLTLQGSYSQASTATLDEQIGGTSASGQFGRLVASGNSSGAALAGTLTASLANGFSPGPGESFQLITTGAGSGLTGTFGSVNVPGLGGGLSLSPHYNANNFTLATNSPPGPTSLVFSQQPSVTTAGDAIDSPTGVQVEIVDQFGHVLSGDNSLVTINIASGPAGQSFTATSTLSAHAVNGVATFGNLILDGAGTYKLSAADATDSLSDFESTSFTVSPAGASELVFTAQPTTTIAGQTINGISGVQVSIKDSFGNLETGDTSQVTFGIASPLGGAFASGTFTQLAVAGVATFGNLVIDAAGSYKLSAADATDSLSGFDSTSFNIDPAGASQLVFTAQPTTTTAGQTINGISGVQVSIKDSFGNLETGDTSQVTVGIASPPGGAFASGTFTQPAVAGVATFGNLVVDAAGSYKLSAADATHSLSGFESDSFAVNPAVSGHSATYLNGQAGDGTAATLIDNLYRELLGREPEPQGQAFWVADYAQLAAGNGAVAAQHQLVLRFLDSPEYWQHLVAGMYHDFLRRAPDSQGLQFWTAVLASGADEENVLAGIVGSDEYFADAGGTDSGFVGSLYRDLLGRSGDSSGIAFWTRLFTSPLPSFPPTSSPLAFRTALVQTFLSTPEAEHKLLNGDFPAAAGSVGAPGTPAVGAYGLADITGNGWDNLYFQGDLAASAVDALFAGLQDQPPYNDVIAEILGMPHYF
ncbi:MAG TPA: DUF4214 domain-containing protein, partial [Pirellulales bacterium]|nr:DUF4214 domain-containing protein [Pirellulales bacterium]